MLGFLPDLQAAIAETAIKAVAREAAPAEATQAPPAPVQAAAPTPVAAKPTKKTKAAEPAPAAAPAADAGAPKLTLKDVRAKLQTYSDDPRFGMAGVLTILGKYGQQRVSDLPEEKYVEFMAHIDADLEGKADPLA